ncbi:premelanosome protein b [Menidia menidia]
MGATFVLLVFLTVASQTVAKPKHGFTRYPSWNTRMYPIWKDDDLRYKDSWKGGRVNFNVGNDSPTLTGAKITFTIDLEFPQNQKVQPDGNVIWAKNCTVNGTKYYESEAVFPHNTNWEAVFPDGTPITKDRKPAYVFVWKTWDKYWQVADGPTSSLTIDTDDIPLGSYTMDIVIYHYRSKERFIPLGYASTQFSITDQIPFSVSLDQVNDVIAGDMRFVQNKAIAFTITLHDPSKYLSNADITFNWDFGDKSGALISRELTVTHTYTSPGSYKPQVVIQAVIPDKACNPPSSSATPAPIRPNDHTTTWTVPTLLSAVPIIITNKPTGMNANMVPSDTEEDNTEGEASTASATQSTQETPTLVKTPSLINQLPNADVKGKKLATETDTKRSVTLRGRTKVVAKREADEKPRDDDCVIYRYSSFCTAIEILEDIQKLNIQQMESTMKSMSGKHVNVLDITVTCQGGFPREVCSVILDEDCLKPIHITCNIVEPAKDCQLMLRHFFNDSGVYCINISMSNDVSLSVTSAKVNIDMGSGLPSPGPFVMLLGTVVLILALGIVIYSYKRFKSYIPLKENITGSEGLHQSGAQSCSGPLMFWYSLRRQRSIDNCPLLQDRSL